MVFQMVTNPIIDIPTLALTDTHIQISFFLFDSMHQEFVEAKQDSAAYNRTKIEFSRFLVCRTILALRVSVKLKNSHNILKN